MRMKRKSAVQLRKPAFSLGVAAVGWLASTVLGSWQAVAQSVPAQKRGVELLPGF